MNRIPHDTVTHTALMDNLPPPSPPDLHLPASNTPTWMPQPSFPLPSSHLYWEFPCLPTYKILDKFFPHRNISAVSRCTGFHLYAAILSNSCLYNSAGLCAAHVMKTFLCIFYKFSSQSWFWFENLLQMNLFMQRQEFHLFYGGIQVIYPFLEKKMNIIPSNYNDTRCSTHLSALCALENVSVRHECPLHCFL